MQTIQGIIFRRTIRASYCSLDIIFIEQGKEFHTVALIQFHHLHLDPTPFRSYLRRECKLGSEVSLTGEWNNEKTRFEVILTTIDDSVPDSIGFCNMNGVSLLSIQKLDMIVCQRLREKYYPTFEKVVKMKIKNDVHGGENSASMSLNKKKKSNAKGKTGHGGGVGKRIQGEIVSEFFIQLVSETLQGRSNYDMNSSTMVEVPSQVPHLVRNRYVSFPSVDVSLEQRCVVAEYLNNGSGVIDAAGGSGHVSMGLALKGVKSTVIDPRETVGKLPGKDKKFLRKRLIYQNDQNELNLQRKTQTPRPIQFDSFRAWFGKQPIGVDVEFRERNSHSSEKGKDEIPICTMCSSDGLLPRCQAIVALHPDEATDDICDFAVANKIPFLIIPCCVFSRLFPNRRIKSTGEAVATYEDLIEFLVEKHPSIRISKLNFDGSNLALWSTFNMSGSK